MPEIPPLALTGGARHPDTTGKPSTGAGAGALHVTGDLRRQAALAGHAKDLRRATELAAESAPEVRATALGAIWRMGAFDDTWLARGLADPSAGVRRRACELAGSAAPGSIGLLRLVSALSDTDGSVGEAAAWALGELAGADVRPGPDVAQMPGLAAAVEALSAMALRHPEPLCRESAIAALGAIGAPEGLEAVMAGTRDRPAIRRRAAVALAAFDDPRATLTLQGCLTDRDWQVRQAAEDLLAGG